MTVEVGVEWRGRVVPVGLEEQCDGKKVAPGFELNRHFFEVHFVAQMPKCCCPSLVAALVGMLMVAGATAKCPDSGTSVTVLPRGISAPPFTLQQLFSLSHSLDFSLTDEIIRFRRDERMSCNRGAALTIMPSSIADNYA